MLGYVLRYSWLATVAATVAVYVWLPGWPHALARLPLWPRVMPFVVFVCLVALKSRARMSSVLLGALAVGAYLYAEYIVVVAAYDLVRGRFDFVGYFITGLFWLLMHLSVPLAFAVAESLRVVLRARWVERDARG